MVGDTIYDFHMMGRLIFIFFNVVVSMLPEYQVVSIYRLLLVDIMQYRLLDVQKNKHQEINSIRNYLILFLSLMICSKRCIDNFVK